MSDLDVLEVIEEMERCLHSRHRRLDRLSVREWQSRLQAAVVTAERGPEWIQIVLKAQVIQQILEQVLIRMMADRQARKFGMGGQAPRHGAQRTPRPGRS